MQRSQKIVMSLAAGAVILAVGGPATAKVEGDTIILGSAISLTGKYSTNGENTQRGYDLAAKRINEMGGVKVGGKSYKIKVVYYDDESTGARAAQLAERLIKQDGVKFMLGPYSSGMTKAVAPVTEKYNVLMVEAEGASRSLFTQGFKNMFAVLSTSEQYLREAIGLAVELAAKEGKKGSDLKLAMVFENDPFSLDVRAGVLEDAKKHGIKIVIDDKMPRDLNDILATLTKVRALKPDILAISGHTKGAVTAGRQIKELQIQVPMIAITHCESAKVIEKYGAAVEGFLCPTQWAETMSYEGKYFGSAKKFFDDYTKEYGETPPYQAAQASAAVLVWKEAFERANSFDTDKLRAALNTTDMKTFYGGIKFDSSGKNMAKPMALRQIQGGQLHVVAPAKFAAKNLVHPRQVAY